MRTLLALSHIVNSFAWGQNIRASSVAAEGSRLRIPNRLAKSPFEGEQEPQRAEVYFDRATGMVTLKFLVQDPHGYFIPGIRRENFVVYENGVRQTNATVEIEHALVSLAFLTEYGASRGAEPGSPK
jgi:hypothetical protein